jgi:hypothetical protein
MTDSSAVHRLTTLLLSTAMILMIGGAAACNRGASLFEHRLVATGGDHSVAVYPDEQTFLKVSGRAQEGGPTGAVGDVEKKFVAKQVDDRTRVKLISSDSNGTQIQIAEGPMKGEVGFVAPQNVD